jgi:hypothetical protein
VGPVRSVLLVVAITLGAYSLLRLAFMRAQRLMAQSAAESDLLRRIAFLACLVAPIF